ncbi:hypothetical protein [Acinetobacter puyangensis]|uniref:hypothetical protein n=1 Tax=Acinetobacter puyangensis TaxID=1096779 RepID=UPI003A4D763A
MAEIIAAAIAYLKCHIGILVMGLLGAIFNALLSKERWKDKLVGAIVGLILCIVFAEHASNFFADGEYPELFGFIFGASGKSTAEFLLNAARKKLRDKIGGQDDSSNQSDRNH